MAINIDLALAFLNSIGNTDHTMPKPAPEPRMARAPRAAKVALPHPLPTILCEKSLSGRELILAIRDAGAKWIEKDGKHIKVTEPNRVIFDQSNAIARYTGEYDSKLDHGGQLQRALDSANLEINPRYVPSLSIAPTVQGYVAGIAQSPDHKRAKDLTARLEKSSQDLCDYARREREAREERQEKRALLMNQLAHIEQARIEDMREQLETVERRIAKSAE